MAQLFFLFILQLFINVFLIAQDLQKDSIILNSKSAVQILQKYFYDASWESSLDKLHTWKHENIWNAYNTFEVLIEYSQITGDTSYLKAIKNFADNQYAYNDAKYAGYDDAQ